MAEGIRQQAHRAGRVDLAQTPTPLQPMPGLSRALGSAAEIWIKRDDCTGLALGGNKARKLEFLVEEARAAGADTLVTIGAVQSNHVRLTAAAARACNLESVSILFRGDSAPAGNLLIDRLLGSEIEFLPFGLDESTHERVDVAVAAILERLRTRGSRPHFIPSGGAVPAGCLGYLRAAEEMAHQVRQKGIEVSDLVVAVGTGGTLAGLLLGVDALRLRWRLRGISVLPEGGAAGAGIAPVESLARDAGALIGYDFHQERVDWSVAFDYVGPGYGVITPDAAEAIALSARCDGIILDPVYTGKAMAGLIALVRAGAIPRGKAVVFLHTGGSPALFAHPELLDLLPTG